MRSARTLTDDIIALNDLPASASLQQAYSIATEEQIAEELTLHFQCSQPGATINRLAQQSWRRIYTLNIDNCFETAFRTVMSEEELASGSLEVINYSDGYSDLRSDMNCSIIHLHGTVDRSDEGYVFSRDEYAKFITQPNSWMLTLSQLIKTDCFIIAGTSFDEIDVEYYLQQRSQDTQRSDVPPSILIEPYPTRLTEKLCADHQFCLFEGTVTEFFAQIDERDPRLSRPWISSESDGLIRLGLSQSERLRFANSFEFVPDEPDATPHPSRFLLGAELSWSMLAANTDVARDSFNGIRDAVSDLLNDDEVRVLAIIDAPGSGKTSLLKRLAYDFSRGRETVFWYTGLGLELEPSELAAILNAIEGPVLVFADNFADVLNTFSLILESVDKRDIAFVFCEREHRLPYIENAFTGQDYQIIRNSLGLSQYEAGLLLDAHVDSGLSTLRLTDHSAYFQQTPKKTIAEANCRIQISAKRLTESFGNLSKKPKAR